MLLFQLSERIFLVWMASVEVSDKGLWVAWFLDSLFTEKMSKGDRR